MRYSLAVGALLLATACAASSESRIETADSSSTTPEPVDSSTAASPTVAEEASLNLFVSNASLEDRSVELVVSIDGEEVVAQKFNVGTQHNYRLFPLTLAPGKHTVAVTSGTGARMSRTFNLPTTGPRYGLITYWHDSEAEEPYLMWNIQSEPMAFA